MIEDAVRLYTNKTLWSESVEKGRAILRKRMSIDSLAAPFGQSIQRAKLLAGSRNDRRSAIFWTPNMRSTEWQSMYFDSKRK